MEFNKDSLEIFESLDPPLYHIGLSCTDAINEAGNQIWINFRCASLKQVNRAIFKSFNILNQIVNTVITHYNAIQ